jgi:hypothetical protein
MSRSKKQEERRHIREEQDRRYADVRSSKATPAARKPAQLGFEIDLGKGRCQLCGRTIEKRCKWCAKGGTGDPPCPEMKAYATWTKGLRKQTKRLLERASLPIETIEKTLRALFDGIGSIPAEALVCVQDLLPNVRCVSPDAYAEGRGWALLNHRIYCKLYELYCREFNPYHTPFEERMEQLRGKTDEELSDLLEAEREILANAVEKVRRMTELAVSTIQIARASGITAEQRSTGQFVTIVVAAFNDYQNVSAGTWTPLAKLQHAHRLVAIELERIAAAEPIDDDLLARAMPPRDTSPEAAPVDEVWPEGWERVMRRAREMVEDASSTSVASLAR